MDARRAAKAAAKMGIALDPDEPARQVTVSEVVRRYEMDGYPDRKGNPRADTPHRRSEKDACALLLRFFKDDRLVDGLNQNVLDHYHDWRRKGVARGDGHRTTDLELNALSNALNWAIRKELIKVNPIANRVRYHSSTNARHCKSMAASSADELHEIAGHMFEERRSEVLGWQLLFEGLTGLRTNEALALRIDSHPDEPGGLTADGGSLCVRRSKKAGRDNPYVEVHDGLKPLLEAHKAWLVARYPNNPYFFPGRDKEEGLAVSKGALTKTLARLLKREIVRKKFTSHGARAFYVLVRRSHGISDAQIAWEINHIGGVATLEKVYGGVPPSWRSGNGPKLSWIPKGTPAWRKIRPLPSNTGPQPHVAGNS